MGVHLASVELHGEERVLAVVRDITTRRETQEQLEVQRSRTQYALEATDSYIFEIDFATGREQRFGAWETVHNIDRDAVSTTEQFIDGAVHPADQPHVREIYNAFEPEPGASVTFEYRTHPDTGDVRWLRAKLRVRADTDETTRKGVGLATDVTELKDRDRQLRRYETIVEVAGDPMYMLDADGHLDYVNEQFVDLSGYDEAALLGEHVGMLMDQDDIDQAEGLIRSLLASGERRGTFEMVAVTADGHRIPTENHITLLVDDGEFQGSVGVMRVITERLERERRLEHERDRLSDFAGMVSHDLRNPLNVAQAHLEFAREGERGDHLDTIGRSLDRMEHLIDDLLSLARAGEALGETHRIELAELVKRCSLNVDTKSAQVTIETDATIHADETRLQQLLENLLRNAVEHGGADVEITVGDLLGGFYVEDDGPGIPEDERGDVLEPGYSTIDSGTGFGLSIVRDIAEAHGWRITVTESADGGARFEFTGIQQT